MSRRRGLTNAEIEEFVNISPTQSEGEVSDLENSSDKSGDEDYVPRDGNDSSDTDTISEGVEGAMEEDGERKAEEFIEEEEIADESEEPPAKRVAGSSTEGRTGGRRQRSKDKRGHGDDGENFQDSVLTEEQELHNAPQRNTHVQRGQTASRRGRGTRCRGGTQPGGARGRRRRRGGAAPNLGGGDDRWDANYPDIGGDADSAAEVKWTRVAPGNVAGRRGLQNVLREALGPTPFAKRCVDDSPLSAWRLFFSEPMLRLIQSCTETEARNVLGDNEWSVSMEELEGFIAIIYARGVTGMRTFSLYELWKEKYAGSLFREIMSKHRFQELMRFLRFDIRGTRAQRKVTDKFCLVSELLNKFRENCIASYKPTANLTVDEMLYPCKVRCPFLQYMPSKPDKYGIKYWLLCDAEKRYVLNIIPYLGKDEARPTNISLGEHVVYELAAPFLDKERNITTDNFFTSLKLAEGLQKKSTSLVGTLKRTKSEVPYCVRPGNDPLYSTTLYTSGEALLTSYQGKKKKNVLTLSSMHSGCDINEASEKKIPETVEFYNKTKAGVDTIDQMCRKYSVRAATRRWPVHVLYNVLDLEMINAHTIYKMLTNKRIQRREFILQVVDELAESWKQRRQRRPANRNPNPPPAEPTKRKRCHIMTSCREQKGNKTSQICCKCNKPVCKGCQSGNVCVVCEDAEA